MRPSQVRGNSILVVCRGANTRMPHRALLHAGFYGSASGPMYSIQRLFGAISFAICAAHSSPSSGMRITPHVLMQNRNNRPPLWFLHVAALTKDFHGQSGHFVPAGQAIQSGTCIVTGALAMSLPVTSSSISDIRTPLHQEASHVCYTTIADNIGNARKRLRRTRPRQRPSVSDGSLYR
jgi:hypothetical protein